MILAVVVLVAVAAGIAALSIAGGRLRHRAVPARSPTAAARAAARTFLRRYVEPDGRVVRWDQGGDTVSEGQSYALLLSVAIGDRHRFHDVWRWDRAHLQLPSGLFAYHWRHGRVVEPQPATDADLETAWALVLAGRRFESPADRAAGLRVAAAVLANETVSVAGRLELVAGPWGRTVPAVVNPSYLSLEAMRALARASGDRAWSALAADSAALLTGVVADRATRLPPDWLQLEPGGRLRPSGVPVGHRPPAYGLDAQRVVVWETASCDAAVRSAAAADWPLLRRSRGEGARLSYTTGGRPISRKVNPLGWMAAAAAARAAGQRSASRTLLERADEEANRSPTYYGDAWVALGRVLLDTHWLTGCRAGRVGSDRGGLHRG